MRVPPRTPALTSVGCCGRSVISADARLVLTAARQWYEAAGGGEGAVLADYAFAALDADQGLAHAAERLDEVLATARRDGQVEVEVLTPGPAGPPACRTGRRQRGPGVCSPQPTTGHPRPIT